MSRSPLLDPRRPDVFDVVWSQLGFCAATRRGSRDVASTQQIVATRYGVHAAATLAARARELLTALSPQPAA